MPRRRRDPNPVPPSAVNLEPTDPSAKRSIPAPVEGLEQQLLGLVQALRSNPELREAVAQLANQPESLPAVKGALSLLAAAERAGDDAPFGKKFDALHGVVVDQGPQLLRDFSQLVAQRAVHTRRRRL